MTHLTQITNDGYAVLARRKDWKTIGFLLGREVANGNEPSLNVGMGQARQRQPLPTLERHSDPQSPLCRTEVLHPRKANRPPSHVDPSLCRGST